MENKTLTEKVIERMKQIPLSEWKITGKNYTTQIGDFRVQLVNGNPGGNPVAYLTIYNEKGESFKQLTDERHSNTINNFYHKLVSEMERWNKQSLSRFEQLLQ